MPSVVKACIVEEHMDAPRELSQPRRGVTKPLGTDPRKITTTASNTLAASLRVPYRLWFSATKITLCQSLRRWNLYYSG